MSMTTQFGLPLLAAAQAQKHVTVNEALAVLDAMAQIRLVSVTSTTPPLTATEGAAYFVPVGAVNAWDTHAGNIAVFANGGWVFVSPKLGWRAWIEDQALEAMFDGAGWVAGLMARAPNGAGTRQVVIEFDHVITAGASNDTQITIDNGMLVFGVTGRVLTALSGSGLTGWDLGVAGATNRYGAGLSVAKGAWINAMAYQPQAYWGGTPLHLSANGGSFSAGVVRLAVHGLKLIPPQG